MTDYQHSAMRANSSVAWNWPHLPTVIRSESTPDVTGYYRPYNVNRHRPLWLSQPYPKTSSHPPASFRRNRNAAVADLYWADSYYFFSPLYKRGGATTGTRPFASDIGPHPYTYWVRYNGYGYDSGHPGYYRDYYYPVDDYFGTVGTAYVTGAGTLIRPDELDREVRKAPDYPRCLPLESPSAELSSRLVNANPVWSVYSSCNPWSYWPYRYLSDPNSHEVFWHDMHSQFSGLRRRDLFGKQKPQVDYIANNHYWNYPYPHWARYRGYLYDYANPSFYSKEYDLNYYEY